MALINKYRIAFSPMFELKKAQEKNVDLRLFRQPIPIVIIGKVLDQGCMPIQGAVIELNGSDGYPLAHTYSDENGNYTIKKILPTGCYMIFASAESYKPSFQKYIFLRQGLKQSVNFILYIDHKFKQNIIYGTAYDCITGSGIEDVFIALVEHEETVAEVVTNNNGEYLICGITPGKYKIYGVKEGYHNKEYIIYLCQNDYVKCDLDLEKC